MGVVVHDAKTGKISTGLDVWLRGHGHSNAASAAPPADKGCRGRRLWVRWGLGRGQFTRIGTLGPEPA